MSARPPRYTIIHALHAWHVFDTQRNEPVAFSACALEAHARARAECYNHYYHLTLKEESPHDPPSAQ